MRLALGWAGIRRRAEGTPR